MSFYQSSDFLIPIAPQHTKSEVCPLQLALLGMVSCLVDGRGLCGICRGLLQKGVGADRGLRRRFVEECDDILLSGLIQQNTVSFGSLELLFRPATRRDALRCQRMKTWDRWLLLLQNGRD